MNPAIGKVGGFTQFRLNLVRLKDTAKMPEYKTTGSAGMDVYSAESAYVSAGEQRAFSIGWGMHIPEGFEGNVRGRSGLAFNHGIHVVEGTVDPDYRGEVRVLLFNASKQDFHVAVGDRIAQIVFSPVWKASPAVVDVLSETERGTNGFGSTGIR